MRWALSRVRVEPVTEQATGAAAELLEAAGLHGHEYAIDATVAEMALRQPGPVAVLTSDIDAMARLCGEPCPARRHLRRARRCLTGVVRRQRGRRVRGVTAVGVVRNTGTAAWAVCETP
ncbi:hypothetical protein SUDANB32_04310 [Streptomyces sp. enrichment culture]